MNSKGWGKIKIEGYKCIWWEIGELQTNPQTRPQVQGFERVVKSNHQTLNNILLINHVD